MSTRIIRLEHIEDDSRSEIGGKAANLARLMKASIPIPDAWVIPAETFRQHLALNGLDIPALSVTSNPEREGCRQLRESIMRLDLSMDLLESFSELPDVSLAVRSSASVEDGRSGSYSGLFKTCLGVKKRQGLVSAIKSVWASVFTPRVLTYHRQMSQTSGHPLMAVLIMPLLDAETAGVVFSANPVDGNPFQIVVIACLGLGTKVVDGNKDSRRYVLDLDSLDLIEMNRAVQKTGDSTQADGSIETEVVTSVTILSEGDLRQLGAVVRRIDGILCCRVDVEFAFHSGCLAILQAREILGLPPYFPDNPLEESDGIGCCHSTWTVPLPPFLRTVSIRHERIPEPPWSLEVNEIFFRHGRMFYRLPPTPEFEERPDDTQEDRTFLRRMEFLNEPEKDFHEWYLWIDDAYKRIIPDLREHSKKLLSLSQSELGVLEMRGLGRLLHQAMDLESQATAFYLSASYPTYESLRRIAVLAKDWLMSGDWDRGLQLALTLIQGAPNLTHEKDAELQAIAWGNGPLEDFIRKWGYSYLARDEQIYVSDWKSWLEDPQPLHSAIKLMQRSEDLRPIRQVMNDALKKSNEIYACIIKEIKATDPGQGRRRVSIFAACVKACRRCFPMKDDRDLVLSHAQSALRWILLEAGRRLRQAGAIQTEDQVFLFMPRELLEFFSNEGMHPVDLAEIAQERHREQSRLSRYTLPLTTYPDATNGAELRKGDVIHALPASGGIAEGKAHIVRAGVFEDIADLGEGDILVLKGEGKVGLTMFFSNIVGLVYENGNMLCHEANLCRELGKPAVVCLGNKIDLIKEGEMLRIDGREGTVYRFDPTDCG